MLIQVRLSGVVASLAGTPRLRVELPEGGTVADLLSRLKETDPQLEQALAGVVPVTGGRAVSPESRLEDGQEVALLVPMAGGSTD